MTAPVPPSADRIEKAARAREAVGALLDRVGRGEHVQVDEVMAIAALAADTAPQPIQWTGDNFAEIESLGLPGLQRGKEPKRLGELRPGVLLFQDLDGPRIAFPGDWLIPEPVTSWRVSTGAPPASDGR